MILKRYFALPLYTLFHPSDGFYDMKYEKKGKTTLIFTNLFLFWISYSFLKQYSGFLVNENNPLSFNLFMDLVTIVVVFLLWCVGNWSITTLMNGEGKFKDIAMATSFSLTPMILIFIPAALISNLLIQEESAFFYVALGIAVAWFVMMLFFGILTIHNYTVGKTIVTLILTFISICIILFIIMLMSSLIQQVWVFLSSIYTELLYRA